MTAISKLQFSPFRANFCRGWAKPLICVLAKENNIVTSLRQLGFKQIVTQATHVHGGAIDHVYISQGYADRYEPYLEYIPKYYSDHDGLYLTMVKSLPE